jgi:predicted nucleic acid-binding protein
MGRAIEGGRRCDPARGCCRTARQALILAAASIKSQHTIACADCFAVATAERHRDPVLTDDPELLELGRPELEVIDVRPAT